MAKQTFTTGQVLTAAQMTSLQQTAMGGGSTTAKTASYVLVAADAGTVVMMNAAGATTITVNTALFATGDSVQIQNIGAGVCTVTAGTATVNTAGSLALTQYEGGQLYFTSTSASIFFDYIQAGVSIPLTTKGDVFGFDTANARIPIGTNNQVLTADSAQALGLKWATPAAGGSMTLLSTTTLTAAATVTVSSISGAYKNLYIEVENPYGATGDRDLRMRLNSDSTTNYGGILNYANSVNVTPAVGASTSSSTRIDDPSNANMTTSDTKNFTTMTIYNYASADSTHLFQRISRTRNASGETSVGIYNGVWGLGAAITAAITSIDFIYGIATGGNWGGGTVRIYGVN